MKEIGNNLKVLRAKRNITQEELAAAVEVTRKTINTIENGRYIPSTLLALRIARYFGVGVDEVFYLEESR